MKRALFLSLGLMGLACADGTFHVSGTSITTDCTFARLLLVSDCLALASKTNPSAGSIVPALSLQDDATNLLVRAETDQIIQRTLYLNLFDLKRIKDFNKP